jgi:hypothetical protein
MAAAAGVKLKAVTMFVLLPFCFATDTKVALYYFLLHHLHL